MRRFLFPARSEPVLIRPAQSDDAPALAALHARCFAHGWPVATFEAMLIERSVFGHVADGGGPLGFIVSRRAADEAEILSVAVAPAQRGSGLGRRLVEANLATLAFQRVATVFLEVEAENAPALALYRRLGFVEVGRRPGYYSGAGGKRLDALTMRLDLRRFKAPPPVLTG